MGSIPIRGTMEEQEKEVECIICKIHFPESEAIPAKEYLGYEGSEGYFCRRCMPEPF